MNNKEKEELIEYLKQAKSKPEIQIIWDICGSDIEKLMKDFQCTSEYALANLLMDKLQQEIPCGGVYAIQKRRREGKRMTDIKELAHILCGQDDCRECSFDGECRALDEAEAVLKAGYRKVADNEETP